MKDSFIKQTLICIQQVIVWNKHCVIADLNRTMSVFENVERVRVGWWSEKKMKEAETTVSLEMNKSTGGTNGNTD